MHYSPIPSSPALHIPDGFLSVTVAVIFWIVSFIFLSVALQQTRRSLGERDVPLMGVLAAAIFAGQMLNFSIPGGTSGHLMGSALAVILLGPWPAMLVMTAVVTVQALLFQDGGILALGANIFNMGVVGVFVSYAVFSLLRKVLAGTRRGILAAGAFAAWTSIMAAALSTSLQLALSGTSPASVAVPAMAAIHAVIGLGEGLITAGALTFLLAVRKDLILKEDGARGGQIGLVIGGSILAVFLAILSPLASAHPDGLEAFAARGGFLGLAARPGFQIFPDYTLPGLSHPAAATIAAGLVGAGLVFALAWLVARAVKPKVTQPAADIKDE